MEWKDIPGWGSRTLVMGIMNATPDSFSGDGIFLSDDPVDCALTLLQSKYYGDADILDIGGMSSRPGSEELDPRSERDRIVPLIMEIKAMFPEVLISIDTYRAFVAEAALDAGANIVNDVWALKADPELGPLLAERGVPVILMHNRSRADEVRLDARNGGEYLGPKYGHIINDVAEDLTDSIAAAMACGIAREAIVVDPGIGFGKTVIQNLSLIGHLDSLKKRVGMPVLLGTSRKSFIGNIMDKTVDDRFGGTIATVAAGILKGADIVRVHDAGEFCRIVRLIDSIKAVPEDGLGEEV